MGIFDKLFRRNKNVETEEVEKVEEKKEELKEEIKEEIKEEVKVENEVVEEVAKVEEPVKVNISQRLTKSKEGFFSKLKNIFTSKSKIDDSIYEELEDLLIQSDVGLGMTTNLINDLEKKVKANKISETSEVYEILKGLMSEFLLSQDSKVHLKDNRINVYGELTHHGRWFNTTGKNTEKFLNNLYYLDTINFAKNLKCSVLFGITNLDKDCPKETQEKIYNEITSRKKSCIYKKYYHENIPNFNDKIVSFLLEVE